MPASHHQHQDILFTKEDSSDTGRPVRLTMFSNPKDGDSMIGWEFGGYYQPEAKRPGLATFRRDGVLLHSGS